MKIAKFIPDGFTPWVGGKNPVPGKYVRVVYRGSNVPTVKSYNSASLDWGFHSTGPQIIGYQVQDGGCVTGRFPAGSGHIQEVPK